MNKDEERAREIVTAWGANGDPSWNRPIADIAAALSAVRAEEREAERERCIVRARDAIACPHCADHEDTCMSREEMETRIADAIRRQEDVRG